MITSVDKGKIPQEEIEDAWDRLTLGYVRDRCPYCGTYHNTGVCQYVSYETDSIKYKRW
jgi:hypothetical protein